MAVHVKIQSGILQMATFVKFQVAYKFQCIILGCSCKTRAGFFYWGEGPKGPQITRQAPVNGKVDPLTRNHQEVKLAMPVIVSGREYRPQTVREVSWKDVNTGVSRLTTARRYPIPMMKFWQRRESNPDYPDWSETPLPLDHHGIGHFIPLAKETGSLDVPWPFPP